MITLDDLVHINEFIAQDCGQQSVIINKNNLMSALSVQQWYDDETHRAAALVRSITIAHGFQDGNKRTAAIAGLMVAEYTCSEDELIRCIRDIACGALKDVEQIAKMLFPSVSIDSSTDLSLISHDLLDEVKAWAARPARKFTKFEKGNVYFEHHSIQSFVDNYIKYFNRNVSEYGNGFEADWDEDDWMTILYKSGAIREINPQSDEGTRKISVDNIDSIILDGSWGTAFAGPHVTFEDYTVYDDIPDIRAEFDI